jgi:hypothetical protein
MGKECGRKDGRDYNGSVHDEYTAVSWLIRDRINDDDVRVMGILMVV